MLRKRKVFQQITIDDYVEFFYGEDASEQHFFPRNCWSQLNVYDPRRVQSRPSFLPEEFNNG